MERFPFAYDPTQPFIQQVSDWIADVFYDRLPEVGFEVRDEQIYMAFQLERAFADKQTIFAEAGVGTGKTLVYLLYAICYARYMKKPAIIACANESLIEQLVKPEGDIAKLARYLDLTVDARLGKSPNQYLCLNKLDEQTEPVFADIYNELPTFVHKHEALQSFHPYGDRSNYPHLNDEEWSKINWDPFQDCFVCDQRHRCGQTISRDYYRKSADIIICSHDFYMEHVWTYESRKRGGQLPLLPSYSSIVFDEGHLLETAAQNALTYKLKHAVFEEIITRLLEGEIRESLALAVDQSIAQSELVFELLDKQSNMVPGSNRREIQYNEELLSEVNRFRDLISLIEEELVFESGLFSLDEFQLRIVSEHLDMIQHSLALFKNPERLISWVADGEEGLTLVVMPKMVKEVMKEQVFSQKLPVVFSSATLSVDESFEYIAGSLGIENYLSFSVPSPYDYGQQMDVFAPRLTDSSDELAEKMKAALRLLEFTQGRALILFPSTQEMKRFKQELVHYPESSGMHFLFEGEQEISHLISSFQNEEHSNLCGVSLWEGLDVPGPALSNVIIWSLPFPPNDPVFMAKRKGSASPFEEVDLPYMLLRLKQGIGRLIRSKEDQGIVAIISEELHRNQDIKSRVKEILPDGVQWKESLPVQLHRQS